MSTEAFDVRISPDSRLLAKLPHPRDREAWASAAGQGAVAPWIFIYDTDMADRVRVNRAFLLFFSTFYRCPPFLGSGLIVLFSFFFFCYFSVFFPWVPLEIFLPTPLKRSDLFLVFISIYHLLLNFNHTNVETSPIKCLAQRHKKRSCWLVFHTIFLMLNVKQGNCEYQLFKSFGPTRRWLNPGISTARRTL